ncbi:MAG: glycosyltransferase family 87 protein [Xanthobacteraceae bacterium]|uniref:glycosyltransferase family 87 protein n=1 Tax=Pseudolabrys sp. TaxID=1960880 RepID=UPI003D12B33C
MSVLQSSQRLSTRPAPSFGVDRLRALARCWVAVAALVYLLDLTRQTAVGLSDGAGRPLGDDFINYWSGAALAWGSDAGDVYAWAAFHAFEQAATGGVIGFYHYSYPPALLVLTAPLAALPYVPALALWLSGSWLAFYRALAAAWPQSQRSDVLLLAAATPAVFLNFIAGQNGAWSAALIGGGLVLLDRRPVLAGLLFGLMVCKPHLALLVPVALIAGHRWQALAVAAATTGGIVVISIVLFGADIWPTDLEHVAVLRQTVLESGAGVWHRMASVFVTARHSGADITTAYAIQAFCATIAAAAVGWLWHRDAPAEQRNAALVLGGFLAAPYLQDYDLVIGAFAVVWIMQMAANGAMTRRAGAVASALVLMTPAVVAPVAKATGVAVGAPALGAAFAMIALASLPVREMLAGLWRRPHAVDDL